VARRSVLVTGASSGIGEACALELARRGWRVFAGVRTDEAADRLQRASANAVEPVRLDVCDEAAIRAVAELIERETAGAGLHGLVNNAGVAIAAPLEFLPLDLLRRQLEVNVVGQLAVTQAMLPALRAARGRVVNVGSISGRIAMPFLGPYAASKFALEALTDALRVELRPWGIHVAVIEPGVIATPIWQRGLAAADAMVERLPPAAHKLYGHAMAVMRHKVAQLRGQPVRIVTRPVVHALSARRPRARYVVGLDARSRLVLNALPWRVRDYVIQSALR
jgi:NAD(P)-dependent dehydrogenase (short-subunit alcohol dehydrogenase family)